MCTLKFWIIALTHSDNAKRFTVSGCLKLSLGVIDMRRNGKQPSWLSDDELAIVASVVPGWSAMTDAEQTQMTENSNRLIQNKTWEAAHGFELTSQMRVHIAAQASLLILGLDFDSYRRVRSIIVHPTQMMRSKARPGPAPGVMSSGPMMILGEAAHGTGPVVIAWDSVLEETKYQERGHNVVLHEFAHKIDMLDNVVDGTPPMTNPVQLQRWVDVCTAAFERIEQGTSSGVLRDYAATNPGEFFAVATEVFFTTPETLRSGEPDVYDVLRTFYRQDPASR